MDPTPQRDHGGCVALEPLFASRLVSIVRWQCLHDTDVLNGERSYNGFVLGLPLAGASVLHTRVRSQIVDPTRAVFHHPQSPYWTSHPFGCGDSGCNIALAPELARGALERHRAAQRGARGGPIPPTMTTVPARRQLSLRLLFDQLRRGHEVETIEIETEVLELLEEIIAQLGDERTSQPARDLPSRRQQSTSVEAARSLLVERYTEPLQLEDVAGAAGTSPFHLCRLFKRSTGLPIHRYLTRLRLAAALERVVEGCTDLTDLALELGFSSHSHLSSAFRKELGLAPSEVRRRADRRRVAGWRAAVG